MGQGMAIILINDCHQYNLQALSRQGKQSRTLCTSIFSDSQVQEEKIPAKKNLSKNNFLKDKKRVHNSSVTNNDASWTKHIKHVRNVVLIFFARNSHKKSEPMSRQEKGLSC